MFIKRAFSLIHTSLAALAKNPQILYPYAFVAFLQLLIMQVLFFAPRYPLSTFFAPMIMSIEKNPIFLHYPYNFELLNKWFQHTQILFYVFLQTVFIGKAILMIRQVESGERVDRLPRLGFGPYVNFVIIAGLMIACIQVLDRAYAFVLIRRALRIQSTTGLYFYIKQSVLLFAPYFSLLMSAFFAAVFSYAIPAIVLEKKNVFSALIQNVRLLRGDFWMMVTAMMISVSLFIPFLLVRVNSSILRARVSYEGWQFIIILGMFLILFIDALQYTAITTAYLLKKDNA